jgi:hypothetical protein
MIPSREGNSTVAVGASYFTLTNLGDDDLPTVLTWGVCDVEEFLAPNMVKFQDYWVSFPARDAGVSAQVIPDSLSHLRPGNSSSVVMPLGIRMNVGKSLFPGARLAVRV